MISKWLEVDETGCFVTPIASYITNTCTASAITNVCSRTETIFHSQENWQKHEKNWSSSTVTATTIRWTYPPPETRARRSVSQRYHVFPQCFSLRILGIWSYIRPYIFLRSNSKVLVQSQSFFFASKYINLYKYSSIYTLDLCIVSKKTVVFIFLPKRN